MNIVTLEEAIISGNGILRTECWEETLRQIESELESLGFRSPSPFGSSLETWFKYLAEGQGWKNPRLSIEFDFGYSCGTLALLEFKHK